jgi:aspartate/methionine/tyrosine aminotransferase
MPKFPQLADRLSELPNSVFEKYRSTFKKLGKKLIAFHLGDTYLQPPYELPLDKNFTSTFRYYNRYCNTFGIAPMLKVLAEKLREDNGFQWITTQNILMTHGAVNALNASIMAITNPGDEVLVLTPAWPFFMGIVRMAHCKVVEVPFYVQLYENDSFSIEEYLEPYISDKTVAIYINSPNNPSGKVLSSKQMKAIGNLARKYNLWVISDEAYESFLYDGREHIPFAIGADLPDRTITVYSFSKMFMVAGFRLGYIVAPNEIVNAINKTVVHEIYSANSVSQYMMVEAVKSRHAWLPSIRQIYQKHRDLVHQNLELPHIVPEAGYYYFIDLSPVMKNDYWKLFERILNEGVSLAPGEDFGKGFETYVRLCFTATPEEKLLEGIHRINKILKEYYG